MPRNALLTVALGLATASTAPAQGGARFSISFPATAHPEPITGRVFLFLSHDSTPEPRIGVHPFERGIPLFGVDVTSLKPGDTATIGDTTLGFPFTSLKDVPVGDYYVQALINVYTPCPVEHGLPDDAAQHAARLALESRAFPYLTYDPDAGRGWSERR